MADDCVLPLSADEKVALAAALKSTINGDRFPLSPRVRTLTAILERLEPPKPAPAPLPPRRYYDRARADGALVAGKRKYVGRCSYGRDR
jgi:hypothetical protein